MNMQKSLFWVSPITIISAIVFTLLMIWWIFLSPFSPTDSTERIRNMWGGTYQTMAYLGGITGLFISRKWGGYKSLIGRSILAFSIGLLCQGFGQTVYTYYLFYWHISAPYPSIGDIGYFGTIPFYIYGSFLLLKITGVKNSLIELKNKIRVIFIPIIMLLASYLLFLKNYTFDFTTPLKTFLDFGYPLGQAIYVSIIILVFILSRKILGGIMRLPILLLIIALILQFFCDYIFLYQFNAGNWYVGGINDFMYLSSYFLMTISLIQIGATFDRIKNTN